MSLLPVVLWHSKNCSTRAYSLPATLCEIIEKSPHVMARRRLVARHARVGLGRLVLIPGHKPRLERVTLRAVAAEALEMRILPIVASGAVEAIACGAGVELVKASNAEPWLW